MDHHNSNKSANRRGKFSRQWFEKKIAKRTQMQNINFLKSSIWTRLMAALEPKSYGADPLAVS